MQTFAVLVGVLLLWAAPARPAPTALTGTSKVFPEEDSSHTLSRREINASRMQLHQNSISSNEAILKSLNILGTRSTVQPANQKANIVELPPIGGDKPIAEDLEELDLMGEAEVKRKSTFDKISGGKQKESFTKEKKKVKSNAIFHLKVIELEPETNSQDPRVVKKEASSPNRDRRQIPFPVVATAPAYCSWNALYSYGYYPYGYTYPYPYGYAYPYCYPYPGYPAYPYVVPRSSSHDVRKRDAQRDGTSFIQFGNRASDIDFNELANDEVEEHDTKEVIREHGTEGKLSRTFTKLGLTSFREEHLLSNVMKTLAMDGIQDVAHNRCCVVKREVMTTEPHERFLFGGGRSDDNDDDFHPRMKPGNQYDHKIKSNTVGGRVTLFGVPLTAMINREKKKGYAPPEGTPLSAYSVNKTKHSGSVSAGVLGNFFGAEVFGGTDQYRNTGIVAPKVPVIPPGFMSMPQMALQVPEVPQMSPQVPQVIQAVPKSIDRSPAVARETQLPQKTMGDRGLRDGNERHKRQTRYHLPPRTKKSSTESGSLFIDNMTLLIPSDGSEKVADRFEEFANILFHGNLGSKSDRVSEPIVLVFLERMPGGMKWDRYKKLSGSALPSSHGYKGEIHADGNVIMRSSPDSHSSRVDGADSDKEAPSDDSTEYYTEVGMRHLPHGISAVFSGIRRGGFSLGQAI